MKYKEKLQILEKDLTRTREYRIELNNSVKFSSSNLIRYLMINSI